MLGKFKQRKMLFMEGEGGGSGGGDSTPEWARDLPEDIRGWEEVSGAETADSFYEHLRNQRAFMGQSIRIPGEDAGSEDMSAFYQKLGERVPGLMPRPNPDDAENTATVLRALGAPEQPDGYGEITLEAPAGVELDTKPLESFRTIAHKHNLTKKQFEGVVKDMTQANIELAAGVQAERDAALANLTKEWGAAFKDHQDIAIAVAEKTDAPPELIAALQNGKASASTLKWLHGLSTRFSGEPLVGKDKGSSDVLTPEQAQIQIDEIMGNREHPYWVASHPGHGKALERMVKLQGLANPE